MTPAQGLDQYLDHWERLTPEGRKQALRLLATLEVDVYETSEHPTVSVRVPRVRNTIALEAPPAGAPEYRHPTRMFAKDTIRSLLARSEHHRCRNCGTDQPLANCCHHCGQALDLYTEETEQTA